MILPVISQMNWKSRQWIL